MHRKPLPKWTETLAEFFRGVKGLNADFVQKGRISAFFAAARRFQNQVGLVILNQPICRGTRYPSMTIIPEKSGRVRDNPPYLVDDRRSAPVQNSHARSTVASICPCGSSMG